MGEDQPVFLVMRPLFEEPDDHASVGIAAISQMIFVSSLFVFSIALRAGREQGHQEEPAGDHRHPVDGFFMRFASLV